MEIGLCCALAAWKIKAILLHKIKLITLFIIPAVLGTK